MSREALSSIDRMWLRMEDPAHPMMITFLLVFDAPIGIERLQEVIELRLLPYARFRQRVVQPRGHAGTLAWEDDAEFALSHHLQPASLPAPGDEEALKRLVNELISTQLDLTRPLWRFHLVELYGAGCAIIGRVHHCLADGPALMQVLLALTDAELPSPFPVPNDQAASAFAEPGRGATAQLADLLLQQGISTLAHPLRLWNLARMGSGTVTALGKLMSRTPDPGTIFRGQLSRTKRVAWSRPVALAGVKALGRSAGATVNDVMLAVITGALRRYLESHDQPVREMTLRAGLSVNLRDPDAGLALGNRAGAVLVDLPVGLASAEARLKQVKRSMDAIKRSPEASIVWGLLNALGNAPAEVQDTLVETYIARETAVVANMPGPARTVYVAGAPLLRPMFWVPALGGAGLCLSIVSYAGQVWFGASTDAALVPDPEQIVHGFHAELDTVQNQTPRLLPEGPRDAAGGQSVEAMSADLDEAIAKLDALLEDLHDAG